MLNIIELEKRWLHYKIKSFLPHLIVFISLSLLIIVSITFLNEKTPKKEAIQKKVDSFQTNTVIQRSIKKRKEIVQKTSSIKQNSREVQTIELKPSLGFMKSIEHTSQPYYYNEKQKEPLIPKIREKKAPVNKKLQQKTKTVPHKQIVPNNVPNKEIVLPLELKKDKKTTKISINRKNTQNDINEIIRRFKKNNNPALSLFVAKKEYELGNYNQAYNYALISNKLDNNIDESWIIFAKSLVKLKKRKEAISTLKKYIKQSHSSNAQILLNNILSGKFR